MANGLISLPIYARQQKERHKSVYNSIFWTNKILHSVSAQCENLDQKNKTMSVLSTNLSAKVSEKLKIVSLQVLDLQICS